MSESAPPKMTTDTPNGDGPVDVRALYVTPPVALEWGYNIWILLSSDSEKADYQAANKSIQDLEALADSFAPASRERVYLSLMRMSANGFARGIKRRRETWSEHVDSARERKDRRLGNQTRGEMIAGFARGAFKLLLMGGLLYVLIRAALVQFGFQSHTLMPSSGQTFHLDSYSLLLAIAIPLGSAWISGWIRGKKTDKITIAWERDYTAANEAYVESVLNEYKLAAESSSLAWKQFTGMEAPTTSAFEGLLRAVLAGPADRSKKDEPKPKGLVNKTLAYLNEKVTDIGA